MQELAKELNEKYRTLRAEEILADLHSTFGSNVALASSLGAEDQVLTDMLATISTEARIFTIDTGRLHPETYRLLERTNEKYGIRMRIYTPEHTALEALVSQNGVFSFYDSVERRKECCRIRKLEPLKRALDGLTVWVTGLRKEQSVTRQKAELAEWDAVNGLIKVNPLIHWSESDVWDYLFSHKVPYNTLHEKGFSSIGCEPCTRAVPAGEDVRSGRWWWESPEQKECGLHKR